jgi:hypothetical protein
MADVPFTIYLCEHCGAKMRSKVQFCPFCKTAELRKAADDENAEIRLKLGLPRRE